MKKQWIIGGGLFIFAMLGATIFAKSGCGFYKNSVNTLLVADYPYMCIYDTKKNKFSGYEVDLLKEVLQRMGHKMCAKNSSFDTAIVKLKEGNVTLSGGMFTITNERKKQVSFSVPYTTYKSALIIYDNNKITSTKDIIGNPHIKNIGIQDGSQELKEFKNNYPQLAARVKLFSDFSIMLEKFNNKEIDGIVVESVLFNILRNNIDNIIPFPVSNTEHQLAFVFGSKTTSEFKDKFNKILKEVINERKNK